MSGLPEINAQIRGWVEKAEHDLRNAECVLTLTNDCPTDTVCFHCQQCAEKYFKALLISRGIPFPKTHDLLLLFNLIKAVCETNLRIGEVHPLNRYSVEARYPGDWDPIDYREAAEALNMAKCVREAVRNLLPKEVLREGA
jgi:HEPN domain-containing protein